MAGNPTLEGEIAIVTGGARGIGRALIEGFVRDGTLTEARINESYARIMALKGR